MEHGVLKSIYTRIKKIRDEIDLIRLTLSTTNKELELKKKELKDLEEKLKNSTQKEITISEHAYLRYFERVLGFNLNDIKEQIITDNLKNIVKTIGGNGIYPISNNFKVIMKDNTIVTVEK